VNVHSRPGSKPLGMKTCVRQHWEQKQSFNRIPTNQILPAATHQILTITSNQALETRTFARTDPHPNKAITVQRYHIFKGKAEHWMYTWPKWLQCNNINEWKVNHMYYKDRIRETRVWENLTKRLDLNTMLIWAVVPILYSLWSILLQVTLVAPILFSQNAYWSSYSPR